MGRPARASTLSHNAAALSQDETSTEGLIMALRTGAPPLRFQGSLVDALSNEELDRPGYSEFRVYRRRRGGYVAAATVHRAALHVDDLHMAETCATIDAALDLFAAVDPAANWHEPAFITARTGAARLLAVVGLRMKLERLRQDHGELVERAALRWSVPAQTPPLVAAAEQRQAALAARRAIQPPRG